MGGVFFPAPTPTHRTAGLLSARPEPSAAAPASASPVQIFLAATRVPMYIPVLVTQWGPTGLSPMRESSSTAATSRAEQEATDQELSPSL